MTAPMQLVTFPKPKYSEQIVALKTEGGMNIALFDAVEIVMAGGLDRESVYSRKMGEKFAEQFVAQFNAKATP